MTTERLYRSNQQRMLLGVCGGIAERYDIDPTLVRLAVVLFFFMGPGLIAYLVAALVIPRNPSGALSAAPEMRVLQQSAPGSSLERRG